MGYVSSPCVSYYYLDLEEVVLMMCVVVVGSFVPRVRHHLAAAAGAWSGVEGGFEKDV
jgi:hypothetical protein